jgi:hypothetical protein
VEGMRLAEAEERMRRGLRQGEDEERMRRG